MSRGESLVTGAVPTFQGRRCWPVRNNGSTVFGRREVSRVVGQATGKLLVDVCQTARYKNQLIVVLPWGLAAGADGYGILASAADYNQDRPILARMYGTADTTDRWAMFVLGAVQTSGALQRALNPYSNPANLISIAGKCNDGKDYLASNPTARVLRDVCRSKLRREVLLYNPGYYNGPHLAFGNPISGWETFEPHSQAYMEATSTCIMRRKGSLYLLGGATPNGGAFQLREDINFWNDGNVRPMWYRQSGAISNPHFVGDLTSGNNTVSFFVEKSESLAPILKQDPRYLDVYFYPPPPPPAPVNSPDYYYFSFNYPVLRRQPTTNSGGTPGTFTDTDAKSILGFPSPWYQVGDYGSTFGPAYYGVYIWDEYMGWMLYDVPMYMTTFYDWRVDWYWRALGMTGLPGGATPNACTWYDQDGVTANDQTVDSFNVEKVVYGINYDGNWEELYADGKSGIVLNDSTFIQIGADYSRSLHGDPTPSGVSSTSVVYPWACGRYLLLDYMRSEEPPYPPTRTRKLYLADALGAGWGSFTEYLLPYSPSPSETPDVVGFWRDTRHPEDGSLLLWIQVLPSSMYVYHLPPDHSAWSLVYGGSMSGAPQPIRGEGTRGVSTSGAILRAGAFNAGTFRPFGAATHTDPPGGMLASTYQNV